MNVETHNSLKKIFFSATQGQQARACAHLAPRAGAELVIKKYKNDKN